jgi:hypothetical protein
MQILKLGNRAYFTIDAFLPLFRAPFHVIEYFLRYPGGTAYLFQIHQVWQSPASQCHNTSGKELRHIEHTVTHHSRNLTHVCALHVHHLEDVY